LILDPWPFIRIKVYLILTSCCQEQLLSCFPLPPLPQGTFPNLKKLEAIYINISPLIFWLVGHELFDCRVGNTRYNGESWGYMYSVSQPRDANNKEWLCQTAGYQAHVLSDKLRSSLWKWQLRHPEAGRIGFCQDEDLDAVVGGLKDWLCCRIYHPNSLN